MSDATPRPWGALPWRVNKMRSCINDINEDRLFYVPLRNHGPKAIAVLTRAAEAVNAHDRLEEKVRNLELAYQGAVACTVADMAELTRLQRMADAGAELVAMAGEMLEWAAMEHTDTCPLYQEHPSDEASCDCLLGDMRRVLTAYEKAGREGDGD